MGNLPAAYVLTKEGTPIGKFDAITDHVKRHQKIQAEPLCILFLEGSRLVLDVLRTQKSL